ncbi:HMG1/2 protein [Spatholobus suberectus]|nr:HMG1/2 protein [Spatholobus suberectus]
MKGGKSKTESKRADAKLAVNKKGAATKARKPTGKGKAAKDPNKPKRPPSAFFVFMEEFRKQFNKEHPDNKAVSAVGKAAGAKWKSMSDAEKAPFVAKSEKRKADYEKSMRAYNKKQAEGPTGGDEEESEKSVSEVNDEDDDEEGSGEVCLNTLSIIAVWSSIIFVVYLFCAIYFVQEEDDD